MQLHKVVRSSARVRLARQDSGTEPEACFYNSFSVMADFVEIPPDVRASGCRLPTPERTQSTHSTASAFAPRASQDRYYSLLPFFGAPFELRRIVELELQPGPSGQARFSGGSAACVALVVHIQDFRLEAKMRKWHAVVMRTPTDTLPGTLHSYCCYSCCCDEFDHHCYDSFYFSIFCY